MHPSNWPANTCILPASFQGYAQLVTCNLCCTGRGGARGPEPARVPAPQPGPAHAGRHGGGDGGAVPAHLHARRPGRRRGRQPARAAGVGLPLPSHVGARRQPAARAGGEPTADLHTLQLHVCCHTKSCPMAGAAASNVPSNDAKQTCRKSASRCGLLPHDVFSMSARDIEARGNQNACVSTMHVSVPHKKHKNELWA